MVREPMEGHREDREQNLLAMTKEKFDAINGMVMGNGMTFGEVMTKMLSVTKAQSDAMMLDKRLEWENWCKHQDRINENGSDGAFSMDPVCLGDVLTPYGFNSGGLAPNRPGVYAVVAKVGGGYEHLLYIGSSYNIRTRVLAKAHLYARLRGRLGDLVYLRWHVTDEWVPVERSLILKFKPPFNVTGKKRTAITVALERRSVG